MKKHLLKLLFIVFALGFFSPVDAQNVTSSCKKIKIACVGNSITFGSFLASPSTESYPAQLQKMLGTHYMVGNYGRSGATVLTSGDRPYIQQKEFTAAIASEPDIVIIMLGTNDSKLAFRNNIATHLKTDYINLVDTFASLKPKPRIILVPSAPSFAKADEVYSGINESVVRNKIAPIVQQIAGEKGLETIDVYTPLKNHPEFFPDKVHPNLAGAKILAKAIYDYLVR
jgi:sialate O-acetylesterase